MREYELTVVLHPDLEANLDAPLEKVRTLITNNGGKVQKEDNWGKKRLAYPIAKENFGVYVYFEIELPSESATKLDGALNITDEVIRHLLVGVDPKAKAAAERAKDGQTAAEEE